MKFQESKKHYESGQVECHYFLDENGYRCGECREYHENGQLHWHLSIRSGVIFGEAKMYNSRGHLRHHYLMDGNGKEIAKVIFCGKSSTHSEEELIEIAKEHNLPLLSELPKTEDERTHWNLKWPELPYIEAEAMSN